MDKYIEYYRKQFYQEAKDILEKVNEDILRAEADPENQEILQSVFRGIHTIKGSAGSFGLEDIAEFTHHLEELLSALRDGKISLSPELVDVILSGADHIGKMIEAHEAGRESYIDPSLTERFRAFCAEQPHETVPPTLQEEKRFPASPEMTPCFDRLNNPLPPDLPPEVRHAFQEGAGLGLYVFRVQLKYTSELLENGYDPLIFLRNLKSSCTFYYAVTDAVSLPRLDKFNPLKLFLYPTLYVVTALSAEDICDLTFDSALAAVEPVSVPLDISDSKPLHEFIDSAADLLETLEKAVIAYETSGSRESLNEIFRTVHNFKGDADLIGLQEITVFAHTLETLLEHLRAGTVQRTFALVDVILQAVDFLRQSVEKLGQGIKIPEFPPVFETLKYYAEMKADIDRKQHILKDASPELREVFAEQSEQYKKILLNYGKPMPEAQDRRKVIERALKGLAKASEVVGLKSLHHQAEKALAALEAKDSGNFSDVLERITSFISGLEEEPEPETHEKIAPDQDKLFKKPAEIENRTMRVEERKVDDFTDMVGELLIAKNTYAHLVKQLEKSEGAAKDIVRSFKENLHLFSRLTNDVHHGVMSLRMIPVKKIFQKFTRPIRDISRKQKKFIQLLTDGDEIEVDKKVADMLSDPLVHLVRNACDHGIERPEQRKAAGKSERGTVIIRASQDGGNLFISVIDDGAGIDRQKIYEKAKLAGISADSPDDPNLLDVAFMPGFSTSAEVSDISGRGVGLDVVKTAIRSLSGTVNMISNKGKGVEVSLSIPVTLGVDTVLFVESGGLPYAIPMESIVETLKIPSEKIKHSGDKMFFHHRDEIIHAETLERILKGGQGLGVRGQGTPPLTSDLSPLTSHLTRSVVIVSTARGKCGVIVDCFHQNTEVAVKPLPGVLAGIDIVSGVSIMGDGRVFLVLDPKRFF